MSHTRLCVSLLLLLTVPLVAGAQVRNRVPEGTQVKRDLEYVKDGHERNKLDLYLPEKSDKPLPLVVWIHGGAFLAGNLEHLPPDDVLAEAFGRFPAISPNGAYEPAPGLEPTVLVEERDSKQSHLRMSYRPSVDVTSMTDRAALQA